MASGEVLSDSVNDRSSESYETSETETIGENSSTLSESFIQTCGTILPSVPARKKLCADCATRSTRTLGWRLIFEIIYSVIIRINTKRKGFPMARSRTRWIFVTCKCPPAQAKRITELIALMVVKDLRPAAIVDGEGFKRLLSYVEPGYIIPSAATWWTS